MLELTCAAVVDLMPAAPFDFDATVHKPDHFPSPDTYWQPGRRWQTMLWQGEKLGLLLEKVGVRVGRCPQH